MCAMHRLEQISVSLLSLTSARLMRTFCFNCWLLNHHTNDKCHKFMPEMAKALWEYN
jgi:hypothetical protein